MNSGSLTQEARTVAEYLWESGAVKLSINKPFRWSSGILSPVYCDNRVLLSSPKYRREIVKMLTALTKKEAPKAEGIVGVATAGIPYASLVADGMGKHLFYARPDAKQHGLQKAVEGNIIPGLAVILVEDLISTGSSCLRVAQHVRSAGMNPLGVVAVFSYELPVVREHAQKLTRGPQGGIRLHALSNFEALVQIGLSTGRITQDVHKAIIGAHEW